MTETRAVVVDPSSNERLAIKTVPLAPADPAPGPKQSA
jgi:hypothetical protein